MSFRDRYQFDPKKDRLGKGGFGVVIKAWDKWLQREVALKFANSSALPPKYSLIEEIKKAIKLTHPNLVAYYDAVIFEYQGALGSMEKVQVGIMELINGGDLNGLIRKGLSQTDINHLAFEIMKGLKYLHDNHIVHLDIKPSNILIHNKEDGTFIPKLTDFGLSRQLTTQSNQLSRIIGTYEYMAPELLDKQLAKVKTNADLWSFGVLLYQLHKGRLPFGARDQGTSDIQVMLNIRNGQLPEDIESIPEPHCSIIKKCLVKDSNIRVQKVEELMELYKVYLGNPDSNSASSFFTDSGISSGHVSNSNERDTTALGRAELEDILAANELISEEERRASNAKEEIQQEVDESLAATQAIPIDEMNFPETGARDFLEDQQPTQNINIDDMGFPETGSTDFFEEDNIDIEQEVVPPSTDRHTGLINNDAIVSAKDTYQKAEEYQYQGYEEKQQKDWDYQSSNSLNYSSEDLGDADAYLVDSTYERPEDPMIEEVLPPSQTKKKAKNQSKEGKGLSKLVIAGFVCLFVGGILAFIWNFLNDGEDVTMFNINYLKAQSFLEDREYENAISHFELAKKAPNVPIDSLRIIDNAINQSKAMIMLDEGDALVNSGKIKKGLDKYHDANKLYETPIIEGKIEQVNELLGEEVERLVKEGDELAKSKHLREEARLCYLNALYLNGPSANIYANVNQLNKRLAIDKQTEGQMNETARGVGIKVETEFFSKKHQTYFNQGNKALEEKDFRGAKKFFQKARAYAILTNLDRQYAEKGITSAELAIKNAALAEKEAVPIEAPETLAPQLDLVRPTDPSLFIKEQEKKNAALLAEGKPVNMSNTNPTTNTSSETGIKTKPPIPITEDRMYNELVSTGNYKLSIKDFNGAEAAFKEAQKIKNSPEVSAGIQKARDGLSQLITPRPSSTGTTTSTTTYGTNTGGQKSRNTSGPTWTRRETNPTNVRNNNPKPSSSNTSATNVTNIPKSPWLDDNRTRLSTTDLERRQRNQVEDVHKLMNKGKAEKAIKKIQNNRLMPYMSYGDLMKLGTQLEIEGKRKGGAYYKEALNCFRELGELRNDARGLYKMGFYHLNGWGGAKNPTLAKQYFQKSVCKGINADKKVDSKSAKDAAVFQLKQMGSEVRCR